jgi:hypothetical protein
MNRELLGNEISKVEAAERLEAYGDTGRIEKALGLLDGLNGYDPERGVRSTHKFADALVAEDPEIAYNAALNILRHQAKDGKPFAEIFTRNVLGLDPARLADFQAISRGEIPEGYEGMVDKTEDLAAINPTYHDAFRRLGPKQKEIVKEGFDQYATQAEKSEAVRILTAAQNELTTEQRAAADKARSEQLFGEKLVEKATEFEGESTRTVGTRIQSGLDKLAFSSDPAVDLTMKQAVNNQIFNLVHESPYIKESAEKYFKAIDVDISAQRPKIDYWFGRLSENIDIETVASLKGHTHEAEKAHSNRLEAENKLAAIGLSLIAQVARKTKAGLASRSSVKLPENQMPATTDNSSEKPAASSAGFDYKAAAAATREGKVLKA